MTQAHPDQIPDFNGNPDNDLAVFNQISAKADRLWNSKPEFKNGVSRDDFRADAMELFCSYKVHRSFDPSKGQFWAFFTTSLKNRMLDRITSEYGPVKGSRVRDYDQEWQKAQKWAGSSIAVSSLDDENQHERVTSFSVAPDTILDFNGYEQTIYEIGPTLYSVWFGNVNHPYELVHPREGHALRDRKERLEVIEDEADRVMTALADELLGFELGEEEHFNLVGAIVDEFAKWRGVRGTYNKRK